MPDRSDSELIRASVEGSEEAFSFLVDRYRRPLFSVVVRMVRDPTIAEDLCQEAFVKAHRALATFDTKRKFSSWLFKIGHNTTIDYLRKFKPPTQPLETDDDDRRSLSETLIDEATLSPDLGVVGSEIGEALERCLRELRPKYSEALVLRFVEGLSYQEIADVTGDALGTVKTNIHRARKELARLMEDQGWTP
ncbi:MAG: sigma-70 family RNA polymerase sigma factor [Acidobacteriota bacterium]